MMELEIEVSDHNDVEAIKQAISSGDIQGTIYEDGEVWVVPQSLQYWRSRRKAVE
jgi:ribosome recycling factor